MMPAGPVLRDIHLPEAPGWWPPAPGWWALAALALMLSALASLWLRRQLRRRAWRRALTAELAQIDARHPHSDAAAHVAALSVFLRRVAALADASVAALQGEAWLRFLDGDDPARPFSEGNGRLLLDAPYRRTVDPQAAASLHALVQQTLPRWSEARRA